MSDETTVRSPTTPVPARTGDFISVYANNAFFESSAWDLKIIFGQLDQSSGEPIVRQNIAVTVPWAQAKLALYWMRIHIEGIELQQGGKIPIRKDLLPPEIPALTPEQENDPVARKFYEFARKFREEFIASV
jgi:hypothetical protein